MMADDAYSASDSAMKPLMRITIASRIFAPEPSAASFRLGALATALSESGHEVTVLTVRPPKSLTEQSKSNDARRGYRVRRAPVLRDRAEYVRGYLQYLSFDVPLFFRLLFARRSDVIISEPPPTTGFFVRVAAAIRRTPYVYYAADIWADGASQTDAPSWILSAVHRIEQFAMRGAKTVLSVSDSLTDRLNELGIFGNVLTVGNGVDASAFSPEPALEVSFERAQHPEFVYAGIASEWHGAGIFIEALPAVLDKAPSAKLRFIGGGSEMAAFLRRAAELGVDEAVTVEPYLPPQELAPVLRGAVAAVASIRPGNGNEFTFPTKLYSAVLCGTPAVFAGVGPAREFLATQINGCPLGVSVDIDPSAVAEAMLSALDRVEPLNQRAQVAAWGESHVSLSAVAGRIAVELERIVANPNNISRSRVGDT